MRLAKNIALIGASVTILSLGGCAMQSSAPANPMSFFVTSANPGKGADFGGLAGADAYCETLAASVGAQGRNWRAYLSTTASAGMPAINARDRIGKGPWKNAKGEIVANNIDELHGVNRLSKQMSLTEKGDVVSGRGDPVNMHDILTGSTADGRASDAANDTTCGNWTKSGEGSALVGHHDRTGLDESAPAKSWNSSHATKACDMDALKATGGAGLMYCFASK